MLLKDFVLKLFEEGKSPEEIPGIKRVRKLDEIHDWTILYIVGKNFQAVSALKIEEYFPISEEMAGIAKGEWELGGYNRDKKCYFFMGKYSITRYPPHQTFLAQKRLDEEEIFMEDYFADHSE